MSRFGAYVTVKQIGESPGGARVWSARHVDDPATAAPRFAVKVFSPPPFGAGDARQLVEDFIAGAKLQGKLAEGDAASAFAPVYAVGRVGGGGEGGAEEDDGGAGSAWFVTDLYLAADGKSPGSLRQYLLARATDLRDDELAAILLGPVRAAAELERRGRYHGNLDASNIFLTNWRTLSPGRCRVLVTDPAAPREGEEADSGVDRRALAMLLARMVAGAGTERTPGARAGPGGVEADRWSAGGRDGEYWQSLRRELSSLSGAGRSFEEIEAELAGRAAPPTSIRKPLLIGAAALLMLAVAGVAVWFFVLRGPGMVVTPGRGAFEETAAWALRSSDKGFGDPVGAGGSPPWCAADGVRSAAGELHSAWEKANKSRGDEALSGDPARLKAIADEVERELKAWPTAASAAALVSTLTEAGLDPRAVAKGALSPLAEAVERWSGQLAKPELTKANDEGGLAAAGVRLDAAWKRAAEVAPRLTSSVREMSSKLATLAGVGEDAKPLADALRARVVALAAGTASATELADMLAGAAVDTGRLATAVGAQTGAGRAAMLARCSERVAAAGAVGDLRALAEIAAATVADRDDPAKRVKAGTREGAPEQVIETLAAEIVRARSNLADETNLDAERRRAAETALSDAEREIQTAKGAIESAKNLPRVALFAVELAAAQSAASKSLGEADASVRRAGEQIAAGQWEKQKELLVGNIERDRGLWPRAVVEAALDQARTIRSAPELASVSAALAPLLLGTTGGERADEMAKLRRLSTDALPGYMTAAERDAALLACRAAEGQLVGLIAKGERAAISDCIDKRLLPAAQAFFAWMDGAAKLDSELRGDETRRERGFTPAEAGWANAQSTALVPAVKQLADRATAMEDWRRRIKEAADGAARLTEEGLTAAASQTDYATLRACWLAIEGELARGGAVIDGTRPANIAKLARAIDRVRGDLAASQGAIARELAESVTADRRLWVWMELLRRQALAPERAGAMAGVAKLLDLRAEFKVEAAAVPEWVKWNEALARLEPWSVQETDAKAQERLERFLAEAKAIPPRLSGGEVPGVSGAIEALGALEVAMKVAGPAVKKIDASKLGPAASAARWRFDAAASAALAGQFGLPADQAAVYLPPTGDVPRLEFLLVDVGTERVFVGRAEVSLSVFTAVAGGGAEFKEVIEGEGMLFAEGKEEALFQDAIARSWDFTSAASPPTGLEARRGGRWMVLSASGQARLDKLGAAASALNPALPEAGELQRLPMTLVPIGVAERMARRLGTQLPGSAAYAAMLAANGGAAAVNAQRWHLRGAGWTAALAGMNNAAFGEVPPMRLKSEFVRPGRRRFGDVSEDGVEQLRTAERGVWPAGVTLTEPTLFFVPVDSTAAPAKFLNLVGNVAEYTRDGQALAVVGGSALSQPEADGQPASALKPVPISGTALADAQGYGFTDVGFRLSFKADESMAGPAPLAQRAAAVLGGLRPLAPSAPMVLNPR